MDREKVGGWGRWTGGQSWRLPKRLKAVGEEALERGSWRTGRCVWGDEREEC